MLTFSKKKEDCHTSHTTGKTSKASKYSSACTQALASKAVLEACTSALKEKNALEEWAEWLTVDEEETGSANSFQGQSLPQIQPNTPITVGMESFDKGARLKEPSITLNLDAKECY